MKKNRNYFWIGYSDLMTTLFFLMLLCAIFSIKYYSGKNVALQKQNLVLEKEKNRLQEDKNNAKYYKDRNKALSKQIVVLKKEKEIIETVKKNIEKLKDKKDLFVYDTKYKRYTLKFDVQFRTGRSHVDRYDIKHFVSTQSKLNQAGTELKRLIDNLAYLKHSDDAYKNVSYIIVVAGSASRTGRTDRNYSLSYQRAYSLYKYWRDNLGIDFDAKKYHDLIELQIAGNGTGGVGRLVSDDSGYNRKNQRFIINIIPKLGEL